MRHRVATLALMSTAASADPIAEFYKGKNLNWILSAGSGGGKFGPPTATKPLRTKR